MAVISQYLSTCLAVIWLRIKQPERERGFRIPGGVAIPLLGCVVSLWLVQNVKLPEFLFTLGAIGVGVLVSQAFKRFAPATP